MFIKANNLDTWGIILVILVVIFILSLPAIVVRFGFLKAPLSSKARWGVSIAYCITLFVLPVFFGAPHGGIVPFFAASATFFILGIKNKNPY